MKILYLSPYTHKLEDISHFSDYQASHLLDGLKHLYGNNVLDFPACDSQYEITEKMLSNDPTRKEKFLANDLIAGRGFSHLFLINENYRNKNNFTFSEIEKMIEDKFFDVIFFAAVDNTSRLWGFEELFLKSVNYENKVCIIDGSDLHHTTTEVIHFDYVRHLEKVNGYYFKRELLSNPNKIIKPINFAFPKKKILNSKIIKNKLFAMETFNKDYKFKIEEDYYNEYRQSFFGKTMKKGGWDCMRHYEIIFNRCIPYFQDIDNIPPNVMTSFPKHLVKAGMKTLNNNLNVDEKNYYEIESEIFKYSLDNLTTEALARKVMNIILN